MSRWRAAWKRWKAWSPLARWCAVLGALATLSGAAVAVGVPALARARLVERAEGRGLVVHVGSARLGFGRVWLRDVDVSDPKLPGSSVQIGAIEVRAGLGGVSAVRLHGARVRLAGSVEALQERWRSLQKRRTPGTSSDGGSGPELYAHGVDVSWRDADKSVALWGVAVRAGAGSAPELTLDLAHVGSRLGTAEIRALEVGTAAIQGAWKLQRAEAAEVDARIVLDAPEPRSAPAQQPTRSAVARPLGTPTGAPSSRGPPAPKGVDQPSTNRDAGGSAPSSRGMLERARALLAKQLAPEFLGRVVAVNVEAVRGVEALRIGPSELKLRRAGDSLSLDVGAHPKSGGGTPLGVRARLPLVGQGAELDLTGGPVSLAALGVREGDFGLVGVRDAKLTAEARVVFDPNGETVDITSRGRLDQVRLRRPALAPDELSGIGFGWRVKATATRDGTKLSIHEGELSLGDVRAELSAELEQSLERTRVALNVAVPLASCGALLDALPRGAAPLLAGVKMAGTFAMRAHVAYDSDEPSATTAKLDVANECRIAEVPPAIAPSRFRRPWQREVKGVRGPMAIESGPGTPDWTHYEDISPHMETAILVCEDEGFFRHRGFAYRAIESSIQQNLIQGRFLRGASTVSMQLAKNLYLGREKTISRKLQEAVLTLLLEQELSKHEIMELYLNVIEFGPGIYGIRQASRYYFNQEPRDLSLGQALYLASILPNPDVHHFLPDGRVSDRWSAYLRKLMHIAHKIRRISDEELEEGLAEQVAFRRPSAVGPALETVDADGAPEPELLGPLRGRDESEADAP